MHVFAVEGVSAIARQPDRDPFTRHVAFGVPDIAAEAELECLAVPHRRVGREALQRVLVDDRAATSSSCTQQHLPLPATVSASGQTLTRPGRSGQYPSDLSNAEEPQ